MRVGDGECCGGCTGDRRTVIRPLIGEGGGAARNDGEGGGLPSCDREGRGWLGGDGGQRAQGEGGNVAGDGAGGIGDDAAELVAGHGERRDDAQRGGGGTGVTRTIS